MIAPVTAASLAEVFAPEQIVRVRATGHRATGQEAGLTHGPTRGFLADVGLPVADGVLFELRKDLSGGPTPLRDASLVEDLTDYEGFSPGVHRWLHLGRALHAEVALDGGTGRVHVVNHEVRRIEWIHTDVSSMVHGMCLLQLRRPDYDPPGVFPEIDDLIRIAEEIRDALTAVDPVPFGTGDGLWEAVFDDIAGGMW